MFETLLLIWALFMGILMGIGFYFGGVIGEYLQKKINAYFS